MLAQTVHLYNYDIVLIHVHHVIERLRQYGHSCDLQKYVFNCFWYFLVEPGNVSTVMAILYTMPIVAYALF